MVNTKIRLIIFFAAKDGEALCTQQKQDQELTVAQIMNSLLPKWSEVAQSCPTICNPMDCSLPGSCVHGIFQAIVLEWIAITFSRGSYRPREDDQPRQHIKKQRHYFASKGLSSQSYGFSNSHVWMWELDHKEGWAPKNWCFWTVVLESHGPQNHQTSQS